MLTLQILLAAFAITRVTVSLGARLGLVDRPDARKRHTGDVPLAGGIAIFLTLLFGTLVLGIAPYTDSMLVIACAVRVPACCSSMPPACCWRPTAVLSSPMWAICSAWAISRCWR